MSILLSTFHIWTDSSTNPAYNELAWAQINGQYHLRSKAFLGLEEIGYRIHKSVPFDPSVGVSSIPPTLLARIQEEIRDAANDGLRRIEREKRMN